MTPWYYLIVAFFCGGVVAAFVLALCNIARHADDRMTEAFHRMKDEEDLHSKTEDPPLGVGGNL